MANIIPVPAPLPGEPVDSAKARVQSSTVEIWVVTVALSSMTSSGPQKLRGWASACLHSIARPTSVFAGSVKSCPRQTASC